MKFYDLIPAPQWGVDWDHLILGFERSSVELGLVDDPDSYYKHTSYILGLGVVTLYWVTSDKVIRKE